MPLRSVLDISMTLLVEAYQELGMKFEEAHDDLAGRLIDPAAPKSRRQPPPPDNTASMVALQAMMGASDFKGMKG